MYKLQIFKSAEMIGEYWLPVENYKLEIPYTTGSYTISAPKCPVCTTLIKNFNNHVTFFIFDCEISMIYFLTSELKKKTGPEMLMYMFEK